MEIANESCEEKGKRKMPTISVSGWMAYAPFRVARDDLRTRGIELVDGAHDRVEGLLDRRYDATLLSTYEYVEAIAPISDSGDFGVAWAFIAPVNRGSDRIVVRQSIPSLEVLHASRIGSRPKGLELNLFEHLFETAGLPRKNDYIVLPDRDAYMSAFLNDEIDAVMVPQPIRSKLLNASPDFQVFEQDGTLPRYGLYAIVVHRRDSWSRNLFSQIRELLAVRCSELGTMDNVRLCQADRQSFVGIANPAGELKSTVRWIAPNESKDYLIGEAVDCFATHVKLIAEFRARRFGGRTLSADDVSRLVDLSLL